MNPKQCPRITRTNALDPPPAPPEEAYLVSVVGTSRCDVRAACSGAISSNASLARIFVPPATTRAGTAQRAIPTITLNTDKEGSRPAGPPGQFPSQEGSGVGCDADRLRLDNV